jgi:hypothetical protein
MKRFLHFALAHAALWGAPHCVTETMRLTRVHERTHWTTLYAWMSRGRTLVAPRGPAQRHAHAPGAGPRLGMSGNPRDLRNPRTPCFFICDRMNKIHRMNWIRIRRHRFRQDEQDSQDELDPHQPPSTDVISAAIDRCHLVHRVYPV